MKMKGSPSGRKKGSTQVLTQVLTGSNPLCADHVQADSSNQIVPDGTPIGRRLKRRRCRQPQSGSESELLTENENFAKPKIKRSKRTVDTPSFPIIDDFSSTAKESSQSSQSGSQSLVETDSNSGSESFHSLCLNNNFPPSSSVDIFASHVFANQIESPNSSVPIDSHEGKGAESTDYGSDYVSGVNLLKFVPTPANLSG